MKLLIVLAICLWSNFVSAQYLFNKDYNFCSGYSIAEIEANSYLFAGTDTSHQIGITKLDYMGNVVWYNTYGFDFGRVLTRVSNNLFLMTGTSNIGDAFVLMVDSSGNSNTVNVNTSTGGSFYEYEALMTFDQNIVLSARDTFPVLLKFDTMGNVLWRKSYPFWPYADLRVVQQPDSGFILLGDSTDSKFVVAKTNALGDTLWTKYFYSEPGASGHSVTNCTNGGFIVAASFYSGAPDDPAYPWLLRFNNAGDTMWTKVLQNEYMDNEPEEILECHDGGLMVVKNVLTSWISFDQDCHVLRLDSSGNLLWDARFPKQAFLHCIQQTSDHGFILTTNDYWGTNVIRFDSIGNYVTLVGETGKEALEVYPNPSSGIFQIGNRIGPEEDNFSEPVEVYNLFGKKILESKQSVIDLTGQPSGIYFVQAFSDGQVFRRKVIKQ